MKSSPHPTGEIQGQSDTMNQHGKPDDDQARGVNFNTENTKLPRWYVFKTLMGFGEGEPDRNKRILTDLRTSTDFVFNDEMKEWREKDNKTLHNLAKYLNDIDKQTIIR